MGGTKMTQVERKEVSKLAHKIAGVVGIVTTSLTYSFYLDRLTPVQIANGHGIIKPILLALAAGVLMYTVNYKLVQIFFCFNKHKSQL